MLLLGRAAQCGGEHAADDEADTASNSVVLRLLVDELTACEGLIAAGVLVTVPSPTPMPGDCALSLCCSAPAVAVLLVMLALANLGQDGLGKCLSPKWRHSA